MWRHGGLVLGVCRRHVRDTHLAEDAFQATFLILSRQASRVRAETLPGFLHRVARRVAGRAALKQQRRRETSLAVDPATRPAADPELMAVLDAEIDRLPDRLRQVVVLCYLNGATTESAAARLNIPRGTVLSRRHTARAKLRDRLQRRGVTPPAVGLMLVLTAEQVAGGVHAAGGGIGAATILANEVLTMSVRKLVWGVAAGLVLAGGAGTGVGVLSAQSGGAGKPTPAAAGPAPAAAQTPQPKDKPPTDAPPASNAAVDRLNARIQQTLDVLNEANKLSQLIKNAEAASRFYEGEPARLNARRASIQAQAETVGLSTIEQAWATAAERTEVVAAHPEVAARTKLLAELWQERVRTDGPGKEDVALARRVENAEQLLAAAKVRLAAEWDKAKPSPQIAQVIREKQAQELLIVVDKEIRNIAANRQQTEDTLIVLNNKLRQLTPDHPDDLRDELQRLRARKDAVEFSDLPTAVRGDAETKAKLDAILTELRELRRLVEAKK